MGDEPKIGGRTAMISASSFVEGAEFSIRELYEPRCSQRVATFFSNRKRMPVDSKASGTMSRNGQKIGKCFRMSSALPVGA